MQVSRQLAEAWQLELKQRVGLGLPGRSKASIWDGEELQKPGVGLDLRREVS